MRRFINQEMQLDVGVAFLRRIFERMRFRHPLDALANGLTIDVGRSQGCELGGMGLLDTSKFEIVGSHPWVVLHQGREWLDQRR